MSCMLFFSRIAWFFVVEYERDLFVLYQHSHKFSHDVWSTCPRHLFSDARQELVSTSFSNYWTHPSHVVSLSKMRNGWNLVHARSYARSQQTHIEKPHSKFSCASYASIRTVSLRDIHFKQSRYFIHGGPRKKYSEVLYPPCCFLS